MTDLNDYRPPADLLAGRVILVTGAGDGLGRAAALAFARHGATVILLGRTVKKLESVYDAIVAAGDPQPAITPLDLAKAGYAQLQDIADRVGESFGRLDGLLHSAAELGVLAPLELYDMEQWMKVFQVNLHAPTLLTRLCLPLLKKSKDASVVFTTSEVAAHGRPYWGAYAAAGAALENLVRIWAAELGDTTVRVNAFDPGAVRTNLRVRAYPGEDAKALPAPETRVGAYLYLIGPDSAGTRGARLSA
jgi:NAD(P)-dependent dehydrogenase (short-subunit alcohol dehydrogenase family)